VRAALRIDVRAEEERDQERDGGEEQHQRPRRLRPLGRHAVPRQIARHEIQQPAIADAPANQRIEIVLRSYTVPNISPMNACARYDSARPDAWPPSRNWSAGMSSVVT